MYDEVSTKRGKTARQGMLIAVLGLVIAVIDLVIAIAALLAI